MRRFIKVIFITVMIMSILTGCEKAKVGELIKKDAEEHADSIPREKYEDIDHSVKIYDPTPTPTPMPDYIIDEHYSKPIETREDYIEYAHYKILRDTKFRLLSVRNEPYESEDSMGLKYDFVQIATILVYFPDEKTVLLDNKHNIELKEVFEGINFNVLNSHGMSWQEPALEVMTIDRINDGICNYALIRAVIQGTIQRSKLIISTNFKDTSYLRDVAEEGMVGTDFSPYGVCKMGMSYVAMTGLADMKYSPLGTDIITTFRFFDLSDDWDSTEKRDRCYTVCGYFESDPEKKIYEGEFAEKFDDVDDINKFTQFYARFTFPLQGSTSSLQQKIKDDFRIEIRDSRDDTLLATYNLPLKKNTETE